MNLREELNKLIESSKNMEIVTQSKNNLYILKNMRNNRILKEKIKLFIRESKENDNKNMGE